MEIRNLYPGSWASNCYLLISGSHAAVVDPSAPAEEIVRAAKEEGANLEMILLTHGHFDHILSLDTLRDLCGIPAWIHRFDASFPADARKNAFYTFFHSDRTFRAPEHTFSDGDEIPLGEEIIRVIHTPGHTAGSVCFDCGKFLVTGDTLFADSRGRSDLYSGDEESLSASIAGLAALDRTKTVFPGHGPDALLSDALRRQTF